MMMRVLVWCIGLLIVTACASSPAPLTDTAWQLQTMNGQPVPTGLTVNMDFMADTFGGLGFCNNYGGNYQVQGTTLTLTQTSMTMMACMGDNRDQLEQQHIAALGQVVTYRIDGDVLTLFDQTNAPLLQFVRVSK
jgi:heat shock protein HslJ